MDARERFWSHVQMVDSKIEIAENHFRGIQSPQDFRKYTHFFTHSLKNQGLLDTYI